MRPWSPTQSVEARISVEGTDWRSLSWQQELPGARFAHSVSLRTSAGLPRYDRTVVLRTLGHFLLSVMPSEGLTEALEGLAETYNFWLGGTKVLSESNRLTSSLYEAAEGPSYERPTFHVAEE